MMAAGAGALPLGEQTIVPVLGQHDLGLRSTSMFVCTVCFRLLKLPIFKGTWQCHSPASLQRLIHRWHSIRRLATNLSRARKLSKSGHHCPPVTAKARGCLPLQGLWGRLCSKLSYSLQTAAQIISSRGCSHSHSQMSTMLGSSAAGPLSGGISRQVLELSIRETPISL